VTVVTEPFDDADVVPKDKLAAKIMATVGLVIATSMQAIDSTIANVALPHLQGSLSAGQDQIVWVLTSYVVGQAIMTPLSGWLSYRFGRKTVMLLSIASFVVVSMACGVAASLPEIVLFRFLQGCSGAALIPMSMAILFDMWPRRLMPQIMSVWSCSVMAAPIFGPILGGWLTEHWSWRWVFFINAPLGALGVAAILLALERDRGGERRPFDGLGFMALLVGSVSLQLMVDRGPSLDWFDSTEICVEAIVAACAFYVFAVHLATAPRPFFPRALFRDRTYVSALIFAMVAQALMFSVMAILPTMLQALLGYSALQAGLATAPRGAGSLVAFAVGPWLIARIGPVRTIAIGVLLTSVAFWQMAHFDLSMTEATVRACGYLQGFAFGLMMNPATVMAFSSLPSEMRTEASVFSTTMRTLALSFGIALIQLRLLGFNAQAHETLAAGVAVSDPVMRSGLASAFSGGAAGLETVNAEVTRQAAMISYDTLFAWLCLIQLLMLALLVPMRPSRRAPGITVQSAAAAD